MKRLIFCIHILICIGVCVTTFMLAKHNPNNKTYFTTVETIALLEQPTQSDMNYVGVYKLKDGKLIELNITTITYATSKVGEMASFNLEPRYLGTYDSTYEMYVTISIIITIMYLIPGSFIACIIANSFDDKK